jgi:hypothetical protein
MASKQEALAKVETLIERFTEQYDSYKSSGYNETLTRRDFIDPFFKALGWDIDNENGYAEAYREVVHEDKIKISGKLKAPDYSFKLAGGKRLFFVEAKKPSILIKEDMVPAYQLRRYGWNDKLAISIITDFEEFAVYDCTKKPNPKDKASTARIKYINYTNYIKEFDFIWDTFSKEAVLKGRFDKFVKSDTLKKGTATVDNEFLKSLDAWRTLLATNIAKQNKQLDEDELNFVVQQTIDRIIFLRIAEDRGIEPYENLKASYKISKNHYHNLFGLFTEADDKYNSGLFDFKKDSLSKSLVVENNVVKNIIDDLYYPNSPYEFSVLSVEILGSAYEQFLGKQIKIDAAHRAKIEEKPEVRKAGGVYYTPQYIVDYIVENTIGKQIQGKTPKQIAHFKIVDPACGSGSFLLGAYQYLLTWHKDYYTNKGKLPKNKKKSPITPDGNLTTAEKKRILLNNIYGVDIDVNAVEVTKLSLLLKCMEGETQASINHQLGLLRERVLPSLEDNIKSGNSLIEPDIYEQELDFGEEQKIKPFSWQNAFPKVFAAGGFDVVIGNPPYVMAQIENSQKRYFLTKYKYQQGKLDLYRLFIEKSVSIINNNGILSFIIPNSILTIPSCKDLRYYLLKQTGEIQIFNFYGQVFTNVSINNIILTLKRGKKGNEITLYNDRSSNPSHESVISSSKDSLILKKQDVLKHPDYFITVSKNNAEDELIKKIENNSQRLFELADYTLGMQVYHNTLHSQLEIKKRVYHSKTKDGETYYPESKGKNIKPFFFNPEVKEFVSYGAWCYNKPDWDFCSKERILIREIPNEHGLVSCYTDSIHVSNKAIIIVIGNRIDNKNLLGILNSKLIGFYIFNSTEKGKQRLFPRISLSTIKNLPVKVNENINNEIKKNVELMLQLNKELHTTTLHTQKEQLQQRIYYTDDKINQAVYKLYNLSKEEIQIIEAANS